MIGVITPYELIFMIRDNYSNRKNLGNAFNIKINIRKMVLREDK